MKKILLLMVAICLILCSCSKDENNPSPKEGYLESPILDTIPSITVDESVFSYIGKTYEQLCTEFNENGMIYRYEEYYEYYFNTSSIGFRFNYSKNEEGEYVYEENEDNSVNTLIMKAGVFIRMDAPQYTREELNLILGEGVVSEDLTNIWYSYNGYNVNILCDGETIYPDSRINISKQTAEN